MLDLVQGLRQSLGMQGVTGAKHGITLKKLSGMLPEPPLKLKLLPKNGAVDSAV
jgi:hypothetical protein